MNIPSYINVPAVDENGFFTPEWSSFMAQVITLMQTNLSDEGYVLPTQSTADIAKLTDADKSQGALIRDGDTGKAMYNENGTWKEIVTL